MVLQPSLESSSSNYLLAGDLFGHFFSPFPSQYYHPSFTLSLLPLSPSFCSSSMLPPLISAAPLFTPCLLSCLSLHSSGNGLVHQCRGSIMKSRCPGKATLMLTLGSDSARRHTAVTNGCAGLSRPSPVTSTYGSEAVTGRCFCRALTYPVYMRKNTFRFTQRGMFK